MALGRGFFWAGLGALLVSALGAVAALLFGSFDSFFTIQAISTSLTVGWYCIVFAVLCSVSSGSLAWFGWSGSLVAAASFGYTVCMIWFITNPSDIEWKWLGMTFILSYGFAHSALMLRALSKKGLPNTFIGVSLISIFAVCTMFSVILWNEQDPGELFWRPLAALAVVMVASSAAVPLMKKLQN